MLGIRNEKGYITIDPTDINRTRREYHKTISSNKVYNLDKMEKNRWKSQTTKSYSRIDNLNSAKKSKLLIQMASHLNSTRDLRKK